MAHNALLSFGSPLTDAEDYLSDDVPPVEPPVRISRTLKRELVAYDDRGLALLDRAIQSLELTGACVSVVGDDFDSRPLSRRRLDAVRISNAPASPQRVHALRKALPAHQREDRIDAT